MQSWFTPHNNIPLLCPKKEEMWWLIEFADPTIIIGVETWLNPAVYDSEIFPSQYQVYRNDRNDGYGGVLIAVKDSVISDQVDFAPSSEKLIRVTSSNEGLKHMCVNLSDYNRYLNQIWWTQIPHCQHAGMAKFT